MTTCLCVSVVAQPNNNWIKSGFCRLAFLVTLLPLRSLQKPQERTFRWPKYFALSIVSSVIAPRRGKNRHSSPFSSPLKPCSARCSILCTIRPTHSYNKSNVRLAKSNVWITESNVRLQKSNVRLAKSNVWIAESNVRLQKSNVRLAKANVWLPKSNVR